MSTIIDLRNTPNLVGLDVLHQDVYWTPRPGERVLLADMDHGWRVNLLAYLRRHAATIELKDAVVYLSGPFSANTDSSIDAEDGWLNSRFQNPRAWLEGTKLVTRLRELTAPVDTGPEWYQ